jgi:ankyrin repeat protein
MDYKSFFTAATKDNGAAVRQHIANGCSPDVQIPDGDGGKLSILHLVTYQGLEESTEALLDGGANPDILDSGGEPPMKMAIVKGHKHVVELLLDRGASVDIRMPGGETLLHVALMAGQTDIAQMLMKRGANPDVPNDKGITARQVGGFQAMKAGGWDASKPNSGASFQDNLSGMTEDGLKGMFSLLPLMVKSRVSSGEITPARAAELNDLMKQFEQAMDLPLEIRSTRMNEIAAKLLAIMGTPQAYR